MRGLISPARLVVELHHCQRADIVGDHSLLERIRGRLDRGLGIKSGLVRAINGEPPRQRLGAPSRFAVDDWVRVLDHDELRAVLDAENRNRGLLFTEAQFDFAGQVMRVSTQVRRMRDDHGRYRPISRTVLLEGADCGGTRALGCGRACPLLFRDEWLVPAQQPPPIARSGPRLHALVRSYEQIVEGLDLLGRRDGVTFMPEMRAHTGKRFEILQKVATVYEYDRSISPIAPLYLLAGLHCSGEICGRAGPCDRRCRLLWHCDWLDLDPELAS
jgi:hypothetical protein